MPIIRSAFRSAWWLPGPHLQSVWPTLMRPGPRVALRRERLELPDGDFLDLDWTRPAAGPVVLILHGLEGSVRSHYVAGILRELSRAGFQALLMHFRGCSGEPNRLPRSYHSGETGDLSHVISVLQERFPERPLGAVGYSLGGNVLLKWLGEAGARARIERAVAVSVPFVLSRCADRLDRGVSRLYREYLLRRLKASVRSKFNHVEAPFSLDAVTQARSFREFDTLVTAPLHGFENAEDYYRRASSRPFLSRIRVPTLIVHAADDPFMDPDVIPDPEELSDTITLELSHCGGHVGFVAGPAPGLSRYWLDERIRGYLDALMEEYTADAGEPVRG